MNLEIVDNLMSGYEVAKLRRTIGLPDIPEDQLEKSLERGLFAVGARDNGKLVGMARLVGDGIMYWYIQDVAVSSDYQKSGVATVMVERLLEYILNNSMPETQVTIGLFATKGTEDFYKKFGFIPQPDETNDAGMIKYCKA